MSLFLFLLNIAIMTLGLAAIYESYRAPDSLSTWKWVVVAVLIVAIQFFFVLLVDPVTIGDVIRARV